MIILILAVQLDLFPTSGFHGLGPEGWKYLILPAIALPQGDGAQRPDHAGRHDR